LKLLLRRVGLLITLAALLPASGCSLLQPGAKVAGTSHSAAKKTTAAAKKTPADTVPNAAEVGL
jgi:hypothetical protein